MKPLIFACSGIAAIAMAVIGYDIGSMSGLKAQPFEYVSANREQQEQYLTRLSGPMEKDIKRSLISPSGVGPKIYFKGTRVNPDARSIRFEIMIAGGKVRANAMRSFTRKATVDLCKRYTGTELSENGVMIVQQFVDSNKKSIGRVTVSNKNCSNIG
jgi:hypothetical protein